MTTAGSNRVAIKRRRDMTRGSPILRGTRSPRARIGSQPGGAMLQYILGAMKNASEVLALAVGLAMGAPADPLQALVEVPLQLTFGGQCHGIRPGRPALALDVDGRSVGDDVGGV